MVGQVTLPLLMYKTTMSLLHAFSLRLTYALIPRLISMDAHIVDKPVIII